MACADRRTCTTTGVANNQAPGESSLNFRPAALSPGIKGDEPDPIVITLQSAGTVTGRLVDEVGRPRPSVPFVVMQDLETTRFERFFVQPPTGPDGRFRITGLIPGVSYSVDAAKNNTTNYSDRFIIGSIGKNRWIIKSGEARDWGDVQVKSYSQ